ncbi:MAG: energy transducer TonB [Candidatus Omnitrophica bacterium]|nr:energy transducer TonB [Candidatus Omnitrophota bacterium]
MSLLKDRYLNIAIAISTSCHIIGMFLVAPVTVSGTIRHNHGSVSFLGSILGSVVNIPDTSLALDKNYFIHNIEKISADKPEHVNLPAPSIEPKSTADRPDKDGLFLKENKSYAPVFEGHYARRKKTAIGFSDILVAGDARDRLLLYRPEMPDANILNPDFSLDRDTSEVVVKFNISQHGFIENPECVVSSGVPAIDQMAIRYVRKWQFVPHDEDIEVLPEGMVRIRFSKP